MIIDVTDFQPTDITVKLVMQNMHLTRNGIWGKLKELLVLEP